MPLSPKKTVIVDTNLFLHFTRLDRVDWSGLQSERIELVVLPVVIRELEKVKNFGQTLRVRRRAAEIVTWLSHLMDRGFEVELTNRVLLRFETMESTVDFAENHLVREIQDDVLIAGLLSLTERMTERPILATGDLGAKSKARQRGFTVFTPHDDDRIAEEPDAREKELNELRKENQQYKNRLPRLALAFVDGTSRLNFETPQLLPMPPGLDEIKRKYPPLAPAPAATDTSVLYQLGHVLTAVPESSRSRYNEELQEFYDKYQRYLERVETLRRLTLCRVELALVLSNTGTAIATDVDVILTFPNGTLVLKNLNQLEDPPAPRPPDKPKAPLVGQSVLGGQLLNTHDFQGRALANMISARPCDWSLETTNNTAHFRLNRLKPEFRHPLPVMWLQFADEEQLASSGFKAELSAGESLGKSAHQFHIIVRGQSPNGAEPQ